MSREIQKNKEEVCHSKMNCIGSSLTTLRRKSLGSNFLVENEYVINLREPKKRGFFLRIVIVLRVAKKCGFF